jgi:hypothetical protein
MALERYAARNVGNNETTMHCLPGQPDLLLSDDDNVKGFFARRQVRETLPHASCPLLPGKLAMARVLLDSYCKRLVCGSVKLATRADHRTNPSATNIGLGLSRRPSSTNLATTLELRPAKPAKPGGSGPTGAKDIKIRHHDDDQQCL